MKTGLIYGQAKGSSEAGPATANAQVLRAPKPKTAKNTKGISKHDAGQPHDRVVPVASFIDDVKRKVAIRKTMLDTTKPKPEHVARQLKHLKKDLKKELTNKTLTADDSWDIGEPATIILPPHKHPNKEGGPGSGRRPGTGLKLKTVPGAKVMHWNRGPGTVLSHDGQFTRVKFDSGHIGTYDTSLADHGLVARKESTEGGPGSGPRPGYKKHPGPGAQMQRVGELPKAQQRIATHAIRRQFARGEQAEGGPGSGPRPGRSKFAPEEKPGEEERQIATFTRREKPGERAGRIAKKPVDPAMAKAIRKALMAKREALVNDETPGPGRLWQKEDVNYRYNSDISRSCGTCEHYIAPGSCEIVSGLVRPVDVCDKWESMEDEMKGSGLVPSQLVMLSYQLGEADLNSKGGMQGRHISTEGGPGSGPRPSIMKRGGPPPGSITGDTSATQARYAIMGRQKMPSRSRARLKKLKKTEAKFGPGGFNVGHAPGLPTKPGFTDIKGKGTGVKVHKPVKKTTIDKLGGSNVPTDLAERSVVPSMLVMRHPPGPERLIQSQLCDLTPPLVKLWRKAKKSGELDQQQEVSPPGWEGTVKAMKKHGEITNPWALAWWMKGQGMTPHKKSKAAETHEEPGHVCKPAT